jgi:hypothetical protein
MSPQASSAAATTGAALGKRPEVAACPPLPLPLKPDWERVEGRLSGGYYRRPGSRETLAAAG